jgi:alpha-glucosidase
LPQPAIWADYSVAKQISDPNSSLKFYQEALRLRRGLKHLGDGSMTWIDQNSDQYLAFTRDDLVIATNTSAQAVTIDLPRPGKLLIASASGVELSGAKLTLPNDTAVWISL